MTHSQYPMIFSFAPKTKRKGYSQNDSPQLQNESQAIVLLCTQRERWVHFLYALFEVEIASVMAATAVSWKTANFWVQKPFRSRILQEHKEKD